MSETHGPAPFGQGTRLRPAERSTGEAVLAALPAMALVALPGLWVLATGTELPGPLARALPAIVAALGLAGLWVGVPRWALGYLGYPVILAAVGGLILTLKRLPGLEPMGWLASALFLAGLPLALGAGLVAVGHRWPRARPAAMAARADPSHLALVFFPAAAHAVLVGADLPPAAASAAATAGAGALIAAVQIAALRARRPAARVVLLSGALLAVWAGTALLGGRGAGSGLSAILFLALLAAPLLAGSRGRG
ncbi:hypothetical protein [Rhodosalinus sp. FB01]|uniref:hypothetical protein n=1 Tax=Rhodosalinus sp. FB01 TaxID=3239194 RepID=UPI003525E88C